MEAPTTLRLRRRVGGRHLAAARQNLPGGKAIPSQNISLIIFTCVEFPIQQSKPNRVLVWKLWRCSSNAHNLTGGEMIQNIRQGPIALNRLMKDYQQIRTYIYHVLFQAVSYWNLYSYRSCIKCVWERERGPYSACRLLRHRLIASINVDTEKKIVGSLSTTGHIESPKAECIITGNRVHRLTRSWLSSHRTPRHTSVTFSLTPLPTSNS